MLQKLPARDVVFGIALSFIAGIFIAGLGWSIFLSVIIITIFLVIFRSIKNIFLWYEIGLFILVVCLGALYYHLYLTWDRATLTLPYGRQMSISGVVIEEPKESIKYDVFDIGPPHSHAITILAPPGSDYHYGDLLQLQGVLTPPDSPAENPLIAPTKIKVLAMGRGFWLREWMIDLKEAIVKKFNALLPQDEAGLLVGVTFGGSNGISAELKNEMELSGTSYILSMYGYKIAAVVTVTGTALRNFLSRRLVFFVNLIFVLLFVLMAGLEPSAIRAGIMVSIALTARYIGRTYQMRNALVFTAAIMLAFDPLLLLGDLGFQLSILGLLGVGYLEKPIKSWWHYEKSGMLAWKDGLVTTVAVLIPMVPVIAKSDGQFPLTAIASNALIFLATPLTVSFGFLLAILGFISFYLAFLTAKIGAIILWYQLFVIKFFSQLVIPLPIPFRYSIVVFLYYSIVAIFAFYYYENE